jgi:hypothetical protein
LSQCIGKSGCRSRGPGGGEGESSGPNRCVGLGWRRTQGHGRGFGRGVAEYRRIC